MVSGHLCGLASAAAGCPSMKKLGQPASSLDAAMPWLSAAAFMLATQEVEMQVCQSGLTACTYPRHWCRAPASTIDEGDDAGMEGKMMHSRRAIVLRWWPRGWAMIGVCVC